MRSVLVALVVIVGSCLLVPLRAGAQDRSAVILTFEGPASVHLRRTVVRALSAHLHIEPRAVFVRRAQELGVEADDTARWPEVAGAMGLELILVGNTAGRGRQLRGTIRFLAADGEELARVETGSPAGRRGRRRVERAVRSGLEEAESALQRRELAAEEAARQAELPEPEPEPEPQPQPVAQRPTPREPSPDDGDAAVRNAPPALRLMLGFGARTRRARLTLATGGRRSYEARVLPEASIRFVARPFDGEGWRGFFVEGEAFHSVGISSALEDGADADEVSSSARRLHGQIGYALRPGPFTVAAAAGGGYDGFILEDNRLLPTMQYVYARPAVLWQFAPARALSLGVEGGFRWVLDAPGMTPRLAQRISALGLDGLGSLFGSVGPFTYAVRFGYVWYRATFEGQGADLADTTLLATDSYLFLNTSVGLRL